MENFKTKTMYARSAIINVENVINPEHVKNYNNKSKKDNKFNN
jgi:hypothetical protein